MNAMNDISPAPPCPICSKPQDAKYRPFCSARCADIDLGRWLKGNYAIPGEEVVREDQGDQEDV